MAVSPLWGTTNENLVVDSGLQRFTEPVHRKNTFYCMQRYTVTLHTERITWCEKRAREAFTCIFFKLLRHPDTQRCNEGRTATAATHRSEVARASSPIVCCLCLAGLLLPWRDKWTPAAESSDTIHNDVFEKQNNYLLSQAVGETESGSFESFHWKEHPFLGPWQPFLFCQCKKKKLS